MQLQTLAMVPVRGTVYIVKLPFICVWKVLFVLYSFVYAVLATIVSVPVYYVKRGYDRLVLTWSWTKLSVRRSIGLSSRTPAITDGTQTLHPSDYLSGPHLAREEDDLSLCPPYGPYRRSGHGRRSKRQRKALIKDLLRILLEPNSPTESEDEFEKVSGASARPVVREQDEAEKTLSLIMDLIKLSKANPSARGPRNAVPTLKPEELEQMLRQAKDREHLQALITELDQLAVEMDPSRKSGESSANPSPVHIPPDSERPPSSSSLELAYTPNNASSVVSSSDEYIDPIDEEELEESFERPPYKYSALSPVQESPEYLTASSESLKLNQLEDELTKALSNLTTAASGLNANQEMVESMETQITQKTVTVTESVIQDLDLESVPKTTPKLGVQVGHEKRQLANARKPRPPSRKPIHTDNKDLPTDQKCDNEPGGLDPDGSESDEDLPREIKKTPNAVQVLPPLELKDQIQLLTSGSSSWSTNQNAGDDNDLDESVSQSMLDGKKTLRTCSSEKSRNASASSDGSGEKMKIPSSQPPWIEMRRTNSSSTPTNISAPVVVYTPPPRKIRAHSDTQTETTPPPTAEKKNETSIWDRDPALDDQNVLYDTLQPKSTGPYETVEPVYLHEKIAARTQATSVEPSPSLPPRNFVIKRTASGEAMVTSEKRGSERRGSRDKESREGSRDRRGRSKDREGRFYDEEFHSSSKSKDYEHSSTREPHSKNKETRQSRSREKEHREHRSSRRHSHSTERSDRHHTSHSGDRSSRRSSSRHHRSHSGDRSSSHSTERHSSRHHSSSDRHRSSSRDKHSSAPSSGSKSMTDREKKRQGLTSPSASKSRLTTGLFSRGSGKDKDEKQKVSSRDSEGRKKSKSKKSSSKKSSSSSHPDKEGSPENRGVMHRSISTASIQSAGTASVYSFDSIVQEN